MHDPSILAFEIRAPIPTIDRWQTRRNREGHKPRPVVDRVRGSRERCYPWWSLKGFHPRLGNLTFQFPRLIEVWHDEPNDADSGTVCDLRPRGIRWAVEHRQHLRWKLIPWIAVRRHFKDRCDACGRRFRWREPRIGVGWDSPKVLHDPCHNVRHLRGVRDDLIAYLQAEATDNQRFRVERLYLKPVESAGAPNERNQQ